MTRHLRLRRGWLLGCAVAPALLLVSCTSDGGTPEHERPASLSARTSDAGGQKKLTSQARTAIDAAAADDGTLLEGGVESVADGVHSRPIADHGQHYRLAVTCAGLGDAEAVFTTEAGAITKVIPCDASVVFKRFTAPAQTMRLDISGKKRSSGVIAWRINKI
ncbi:hypothetical protein [Streptomyces sp. NBC_01361]|uniref:hypothetical protein n=1 Tax=Streptomyces sp. NBC_01361 TaxID=2903838 RepID=UPI002E35D809|nr:hypothetical protein [Streptomyces sp. NBC_01361]